MGLMFVFAVCAFLAGCVSDEQQIAALEQADDAACRSTPQVPYAECRNLRIQYRQMQAQQQQAAVAGLGARLRNAGQALQSIDQNRPSTMSCRPNVFGSVDCTQF